ncbi:hypothetical protein L841_5464 [Mycobacterium sp. MAC_080597_8934]|nr:hypothetical protein L840_4278 [Mycobacterium sp. MAC_011194_8550]ETZ58182.1 hypothetical protein L841_5467 [Mycobacterium sp. MAC_080597_8934]ETZ58197.1 hypothetical protein L841_5464 [Mycobacterium sp. MAC_080597_8934]
MGCVAEEKHVAIPPPVRQLGTEGVFGHPHQFEVFVGYVADPR